MSDDLSLTAAEAATRVHAGELDAAELWRATGSGPRPTS